MLHQFSQQKAAELAGAVEFLIGDIPDANPADQDGSGEAFRFGDEVQAVIHAVNEIHIRNAGRPVHDFVARGHAPGGVTGGGRFHPHRLPFR